MQIAIVGLAGSGKTTVFNTLTRGHAQTGGYGGMELHVGAVKVPDERLDRLAEIFKPKKIVQADVTYFDLAAPPASSDPDKVRALSRSQYATSLAHVDQQLQQLRHDPGGRPQQRGNHFRHPG